MYEEILYDVDERIATITLNRPDKLNAVTDLTQQEMRHAMATAEMDEDVVGIILTGAGRGFCAGVDMGSLSQIQEAGVLHVARTFWAQLAYSYEPSGSSPQNSDTHSCCSAGSAGINVQS